MFVDNRSKVVFFGVFVAAALSLFGALFGAQNASAMTELTPPAKCFEWVSGRDNQINYKGGDVDCKVKADDMLVIPETIDGVKVETIDGFNFNLAGNIGGIGLKFPKSLKVLGYYAINRRSLGEGTSLTKVELNEGLQKINGGAFDYHRLTELTIPDSVTEIGPEAFSGNNITRLKLSPNIKSIDILAFAGNKLTSLEIPEGVRTIDEMAFHKNQLSNLKLPNSLVEVGRGAFAGNKIESVSLPGTTKVGDYAFICNSINSVNFSSKLKSIGRGAFAGNILKEVAVPDSVTEFLTNNEYNQQSAGIHPFALQGHSCIGMYDAGEVGYFPPSDFEKIAEPRYLAIRTSPDTAKRLKLTSGCDGYQPLNRDMSGAFVGRFDMIKADIACRSAHLINPVKLTLKHTNAMGSQVENSTSSIGIKSDGTQIDSYLLKDGPSLDIPRYNAGVTDEEYNNLSSEDEEAMLQKAQESFAQRRRELEKTVSTAFYQVGDKITYTPPAVSGYDNPRPIEITLASSGENDADVHTVIYLKEGSQANSQPSRHGIAPISTKVVGNKLAETGDSLLVYLIGAGLLLVTGTALLIKR